VLFQPTDATIAVAETRIQVPRLDLETLSSVAHPIQLSIAELRLRGLNILRNQLLSTCSTINPASLSSLLKNLVEGELHEITQNKYKLI
jgi:hypothetical protein